MERAMGIEPTSEAWEASILPLYDARSGLLILAAFGAAEQPFRLRNDDSVGGGVRRDIPGFLLFWESTFVPN